MYGQVGCVVSNSGVQNLLDYIIGTQFVLPLGMESWFGIKMSHGKIAFSINSTGIYDVIMHYSVLLCKVESKTKKIIKLHAY